MVRKGTTARLAAPVSAAADDREARRPVAVFYQATLKDSPEAARFLAGRLTDPEELARFQIRFANPTLGMIPSRGMSFWRPTGAGGVRGEQYHFLGPRRLTVWIWVHWVVRIRLLNLSEKE